MPEHDPADRLRVGAVNYLNTKPLIEGLESDPRIKLSLELPSRLATQLDQGLIDVGLIPVIEYFRNGTYRIIPDIAIASDGPVLSVTIFSRVPWTQIRSIALDEGSRTSATLARILLAERPGSQPLETQQLPIDADVEEVCTDAVLLIGDRAMHACLPRMTYSYDLGREWKDRTGLPMVFAVWAVRPEVECEHLVEALQEAKERGLSRSGIIAARESARLNLDAGYCRRYFDTIIRYDLGPRELAGLQLYYARAAELGLAPKGVELELDHRPNLVQSR